MLVDGLDIRFLITTRTRPDWFTPRLEVYGEGLEISVDQLAMTDDEATRVLAALGAVAGRARLMRTADGWPAVLGLAAMSGDVDFTSSRLLSHTLYDFLASELLAAASWGSSAMPCEEPIRRPWHSMLSASSRRGTASSSVLGSPARRTQNSSPPSR
jgi:hypothetical protein